MQNKIYSIYRIEKSTVAKASKEYPLLKIVRASFVNKNHVFAPHAGTWTAGAVEPPMPDSYPGGLSS